MIDLSPVLTPDQLLTALYMSRPPRTYPKALISDIWDRWEDTAPLLVAQLQRAIDETAGTEVDTDGAMLSAVLLGHKRDARGHDALRRLVGAPEEVTGELLGDLVELHLAEYLASTLPADPGAGAALLALAMRPGLGFAQRSAAMDAVVYAIVDQRLDRLAA
ncbi:MAG: hypothetical protein KC502_21260, partial [Myxococcales bacterium]|nr:hypothetical protein [Myxococcales bacterium]